ncbi:hypothetical protein MC885_012881 [Smutsia gigantea]|nr:hypothetical protein MC885_012881 [Smutsia gigantea]
MFLLPEPAAVPESPPTCFSPFPPCSWELGGTFKHPQYIQRTTEKTIIFLMFLEVAGALPRNGDSDDTPVGGYTCDKNVPPYQVSLYVGSHHCGALSSAARGALSPWPLPAVRVASWSPVSGSQHLQVPLLDLRSADLLWWKGRHSREVQGQIRNSLFVVIFWSILVFEQNASCFHSQANPFF